MQSSTPSLSMEDMLVLDKCAVIENRCAELYHHFADQQAGMPELAKLWHKTALEEEHHALQFQMVNRMKGQGITALKIDISRVSEVLNKLDALLEQVKRSTVSPEDALKLGVKVENYLSDLHANSIIVCADPEMAQLFDAMMKIDRDHVARLEKALEKLMAKG